MIEVIKGNLFDYKGDILINTVNCVGIMGKGIALEYKNRFPKMFQSYKKACKNNEVHPGKLHIWRTNTEWIINFPTKRHWRNDSLYEDIGLGLKSLRKYLEDYGELTVLMPPLGCGNGNLKWNNVLTLIKDQLFDIKATIIVFKP